MKHDEQYDGYSALVTTVPRTQGSADQLFTKFKQQNYSEHVNHIFKGQTILKAFSTYTVLIHHTRLGREVQPTRLTARQRQLLQHLGFPSPAKILSQRLPRAPT